MQARTKGGDRLGPQQTSDCVITHFNRVEGKQIESVQLETHDSSSGLHGLLEPIMMISVLSLKSHLRQGRRSCPS